MSLFADESTRPPRIGGDRENHRPPGPLILGCRWADRGIQETLVEIDPAPLLSAAATSTPIWRAP